MKVVIAVDSFKGSINSYDIGISVQKGINNVFPMANIQIVSMADGGEGTVDALVRESGGNKIYLNVHGPLMDKINASYGIMGDNKTAVIEMASASGLPLISEEYRNPMNTTTYGTGELIKDAISKGCREIIVGIGGSATNDAGMGMLQALGYEFFDRDNNLLGYGGKELQKVDHISTVNVIDGLNETHFTIACDVDNPFYGPKGATHIYGKQKGADDDMINDLDLGLKHFASIILRDFHKDISQVPGSGAAGGLGGGFLAFLNAELEPGVDIVIDELNLKEIVKDADFVITGEGRLDHQTSMGKTPVGVAKCAKEFNIPVIALAGSISEGAEEVHNHGIDAFFSIISKPITLDEAMNKSTTEQFLVKHTEELFRLIKAIKR